MTVHTMDKAPRDGTRILLKFHIRMWNEDEGRHVRVGTKWEERWWKDAAPNVRSSHWQPWNGSKHYSSTGIVSDRDAIAWMELPLLPKELT